MPSNSALSAQHSDSMTKIYRITRQKEAILSVLTGLDGPLLPEEIHRRALGTVPSLGIATVYRFLKRLLTEGRLCCVEIPGEAPRYELSDKGHHHHFHCGKCRRVFDLQRCVEGLRGLAPDGFRITGHEIILYGLCRVCAG